MILAEGTSRNHYIRVMATVTSNGAPQLEDAKLLHLVALLCVIQVFYIVSCIILHVLLFRVGGVLA